jgi:hypothetical protein
LQEEGAGWHREQWQSAIKRDDLVLLRQMLLRPRVARPDREACNLAVHQGRLSALQLFDQHGVNVRGILWLAGARYGRLAVLRWAAELGVPYDHRAMSLSITGDHLEVADYVWPFHM